MLPTTDVCLSELKGLLTYLLTYLLTWYPQSSGIFIIVSLVSVIDRLFTVWGIGPEPTSLRGLGGLISEWPSPRWVCLASPICPGLTSEFPFSWTVLPEKAKRAPSSPVWNRSFPSPKVKSVGSALFRNIRHNLSESPRERLPPSAARRTRPYAVVPQREASGSTKLIILIISSSQ